MVARAPGEAAAERRQLRRTHRDIGRALGRVDALAQMAGSLADRHLEFALQDLLDALTAALLPHFAWEEQELIPALGGPTAAPSAGRLLCQQHAQICQALARLEASRMALRGEPTYRQLADLRARLYGLQALLCAHLEQEEDVLLPTLGAATDAGAPAGEG